MRLYIFGFLLSVVGTMASGQSNPLRIGDWATDFPYRTGSSVTQSAGKVFFSAPYSVFSVDKDDNEVTYYTKGNQLSDVDIKTIRYSQPNELLVVAYQSARFDLVSDSETETFTNIEKNNGIVGEKVVNNIQFEKDTFMYLSCGFGLVQFNLKKREFGFTTFTENISVFCTQVFLDYIYMGTSNGIYRAKRFGSNLSDFNEWESVNAGKCKDMAVYNGELLCIVGGALFKYDQNFELKFVYFDGDDANYISAGNDYFFVSSFFKLSNLSTDFVGNLVVNNCIKFPTYAVQDQARNIWVSDAVSGFYKITKEGVCSPIVLNSPALSNGSEMVYFKNNLWVVSGGASENISPLDNGNGFNRKDAAGQWSVFNFNNNDSIKINSIFDFYKIAIHPVNGKAYFASYSKGLVEFDTSTSILKLYNSSNSTLQLTEGDNRVRTSGLAFDKDNNLWISNYNATSPLSVLTSNGVWNSFTNGLNRSLLSIVIDNYGYKWIASNNGLLIYDSGKDPLSDQDDRYRFIETVPTQKLNQIDRVNAIVKDLDGDIWLGTTNGAIVFECGSNPFDNNCRGTRRIVVNGGFAEYLLTDEEVKCIAVDGANRKWFGTTSGLFLQSPNGETEIIRYTKENSPLPDNVVSAITIDNATGIVYVMTSKGLVSFRSDAIIGEDVHAQSVYAFPNPVRPEYDGPIAIKGVASDANVKITDISGAIVFEGKALGGQAIWDGKDLSGKRASSGVYLVYSTGTNDIEVPDGYVTKLVLIAK